MKIVVGLVLAMLTSIASAATAAPKVVFIGDDMLYAWQTSGEFSQHPNWVGEGFSTAGAYGFVGSTYMVNQFPSVIAQHPAVVYIMAGASDMAVLVPNEGWLLQRFATNITSIVNSARTANIKVVLTTVPSMPVNAADQPGTVLLFNQWIEQFGLTNNIPVVNLHDMLCQCVGATLQLLGTADVYGRLYGGPSPGGGNDLAYMETLSQEGYELLTSAAQTAISTVGYTMGGGYLSDVALRPDESVPLPQQNTVPIGTTVQFTPVAWYENGPTVSLTNTDLNGRVGTWASSNPAVMTIGTDGSAYALSPGEAIITFKTLGGLSFSEWIMYIQPATTVVDH